MTFLRDKARIAAGHGGDVGLEAAAEYLLKAADDLIPVRTGATEAASDAGLIAPGNAAVVFTGPKAIALHEDMKHKHAAGKTAKYLERPFISEHAKLLEMIAEGIRGELH